MSEKYDLVILDEVNRLTEGVLKKRCLLSSRDYVPELPETAELNSDEIVAMLIKHGGAEEARACGADAIRAVALLTVNGGKVYPIFKSKRVYRTGTVEAVLDRMIDRAREAYARCNEHRKEMSDKGREELLIAAGRNGGYG